MTRCRNFQIGYPYHVIGRGNQKEIIFKKDSDFRYFYSLVMKYSDANSVPIFALCLMPNHYHLLLLCLNPYLIPKMMHIVNCAYSAHMKKSYKWVGHIFQSRYKSYKIGDLIYFQTVLRYIIENPVKAGLCSFPEEYQWRFSNQRLIEKITHMYE